MPKAARKNQVHNLQSDKTNCLEMVSEEPFDDGSFFFNNFLYLFLISNYFTYIFLSFNFLLPACFLFTSVYQFCFSVPLLSMQLHCSLHLSTVFPGYTFKDFFYFLIFVFLLETSMLNVLFFSLLYKINQKDLSTQQVQF